MGILVLIAIFVWYGLGGDNKVRWMRLCHLTSHRERTPSHHQHPLTYPGTALW